ncbi:MAG: ABC transporter substrate-binding protein, partial [Myxococcota bacterium]
MLSRGPSSWLAAVLLGRLAGPVLVGVGVGLSAGLVTGCADSAPGERSGSAATPPAGEGPGGSYRAPDTLIVGRAGDASALDPAVPTDTESAEVIEQIFESLVRYRPESGTFEPGLATRWTTEAGGREWIFELRRGVRFHDGTALDADAVVFSLERQRDPRHPFHRDAFNYWRTAFANVQSVAADDSHRVRITLERPYAPFLANMSMYPVAAVSPGAVAKSGADFARQPIGTGPFRFVSWRGGRIVLERNPDYWGRPAALRR